MPTNSGLSLSEMRTLLRNSCGTDEFDEGFDSDAVDLLLNRSYWDLLDRLNFRENEITIPFTFADGSRKYALPGNFNALRSIAIFDENGQSHPLDQITQRTYDSVYNNSTTDEIANARPTLYFRERNFIQVYPTPDADYDAELRYWRCLEDLSDDNTTLDLPASWHECVLQGGIWRGYIIIGDMSRMQQNKNLQNAMIADMVPTQAKEETDNKEAHVEVPGRDYP